MVNSVQEFELRKKLSQALKSGRYLVTVTYLDEESGKLNHYHLYNEFPTDDLLPSLSHIANEIDGTVNGAAKDHP